MRRALPTMAIMLMLAGCPPPETDVDPEVEPGVVGVEPMDPTRMGPDQHITYAADEVVWTPGPESLPDGSEVSVLEGDPSDEGIFVMRLRFPADYQIPPHWHPNFERVTVLEGTFHLGTGSEFDAEAATPLPAGSFTVMPPNTQHFAWTDETTVIQLTSVGPWEINYVDSADDPRG